MAASLVRKSCWTASHRFSAATEKSESLSLYLVSPMADANSGEFMEIRFPKVVVEGVERLVAIFN